MYRGAKYECDKFGFCSKTKDGNLSFNACINTCKQNDKLKKVSKMCEVDRRCMDISLDQIKRIFAAFPVRGPEKFRSYNKMYKNVLQMRFPNKYAQVWGMFVSDETLFTKLFDGVTEKEEYKELARDVVNSITEGITGIIDSLSGSIITYEEIKELYQFKTLVGIGGGSASIIVKAHNKEDSEEDNVILKILPIDNIDEIEEGLDEELKAKIRNIQLILFAKESWINCELFKLLNISSNFVCSPRFIVGYGIPEITVEQLEKAHESKKWTMVDRNILKTQRFGYIEMEYLDGSMNDIVNGKELDIGIMFELMYGLLVPFYKLGIEFFDVHKDNIGYVDTEIIRHYIIKTSVKTYNFYVNNMKIIKLLDFEHFQFVNREKFFKNDTYGTLLYHITKNNLSDHYNQFKNEAEHKNFVGVTTYLYTHKDQSSYVDSLCEAFGKNLPKSLSLSTTMLSNNRPIETYVLDTTVAFGGNIDYIHKYLKYKKKYITLIKKQNKN